MTKPRKIEGITILELMTVMVAIGILITILVPAFRSLQVRAQRAKCVSNLRTLYTAANHCVQQEGKWPQIKAKESSPEEYAKAWVKALDRYGIHRINWICPTIQERMGNPDFEKAGQFRVDYLATQFDDNPGTPYRWIKQPWFAERADVHGQGNIFIITDGSIHELKTFRLNVGKQ